VGTAKRERQKANRQIRLQELERQQRRAKTKRVTLRWVLLAVVGVIAIIGISFLIGRGGGDDNSSSTTVPADTSASSVPDTSAQTVPASTAFPPPSTVPGATLTGDTPCPAADGSSPRTIKFAKAPPMCFDAAKTYTAQVETNKGTFSIALDAKKAPQNVNNFVVLARYHYFDGTECHRIITDFVVQCGDPAGTGTGFFPGATITGEGLPGYTIPDELPKAGDYKVGSLAMANTGAPNTAGSQFFIITGAQGASLPPQYSLFGQVSQGYDTTVSAMAAAAGPAPSATNQAGGTPTKEQIVIQKVTITES
jgi:cyclophilin family peptidyl-prolyl cis-trans isomerase